MACQPPITDLDAAEQTEFVEMPFKPTRECTAESSAKLYRGQVDLVLPSMMITQSSAIPLMKDTEPSPVYDMGPERGGEVKAYLHVVSETPGAFDVEVPLRMMPYKTAKDPKMCFDLGTCRQLDTLNRTLEEHNRYITSLLSLFANKNGCGTSAGHVTLPPPPENLAETRIVRLKEIVKDKYGSTLLAVKYLFQHKKDCEKDYQIENAVQFANEVAFEKYVHEKQQKGQFRFRIPGSPPAFWDGFPTNRDSFGRRVKWVKGENHCFISPEVIIVLANDELVTNQ